MTDLVAPGSRESTEVIHAHLRRRILSGAIAAGSTLSQVGVAQECGVSRGPVREAFRLLQHERLLDIEVNQRARVAPLRPADIEHLYALRVVNEAVALAVTVPQLSAAELADMESMAAAVAAADPADFPAWDRQHQQFHTMLLAYAGLRMQDSLRTWAEHTQRYRRAYVSADEGDWLVGAAEHAELARLCRVGNAEAAASLLARHLSRAGLSLVSMIDATYEPALLRAALAQVASGR